MDEENKTVSIEPLLEEIDIDAFAKIDLRVGLVIEAKEVEGAKKLLELTVDVGEPQPRKIFSGIAQAMTPDDVRGKKMVVVANLAPRKMRFGVSEGMLLFAGSGGKDLQVVEVGDDAEPGSKVS